MNEQIINYINSQRVGVLAVEMPDGSPHAATVHFGHIENPLRFIILTDRTTRKCESIAKNGECRASFVLGQSETEMKALQMDGTLESTTDEAVISAYLKKFPSNEDKEEKENDPDEIFLIFTPTWWRFTDWKTPEGQQIITSE